MHGQSLKIPGVEAPRFHDSPTINAVSVSALNTGRITHRESFLVLISHFLSRTHDYVNEKIPITPSEIEPVTFRLVAQCLNQLRYRVTS